MNEFNEARFYIKDNRIIGGGYKASSFMFGYYQLFNFLNLEDESKQEEIIKKLDRGVPVGVSHYTIIKDLFYKGGF